MGVGINKGADKSRLLHPNLIQLGVFIEKEIQPYIYRDKIACNRPLQI